MKRRWLLLAITAAALVGVAAPMVAYADKGRGNQKPDRVSGGNLDVVGVTADGRLIEFKSNQPKNADSIAAIWGLTGDTRLVGIDYRPATGELIGLGDRAACTPSPTSTPRRRRSPSWARSCRHILRRRLQPDGRPPPSDQRHGTESARQRRQRCHQRRYAAVVHGRDGAGYTNNDADPNTATTLFDLDSALDQVVVQSPANSGMLAATGKLGVDASPAIGFDVYSAVRNGTTVTCVRSIVER